MGKGGTKMLWDKSRENRERELRHFVPDSRWKHSEFIPSYRRDKTFVRDSRFGRDAPREFTDLYTYYRRNAEPIQDRTNRNVGEEGRQTRCIQGLLWQHST